MVNKYASTITVMIMLLRAVSRSWVALPPPQERSIGNFKDGDEVHEIRSPIPVCLLHADSDREQTAGGR